MGQTHLEGLLGHSRRKNIPTIRGSRPDNAGRISVGRKTGGCSSRWGKWCPGNCLWTWGIQTAVPWSWPTCLLFCVAQFVSFGCIFSANVHFNPHTINTDRSLATTVLLIAPRPWPYAKLIRCVALLFAQWIFTGRVRKTSGNKLCVI